MERTILNSVVEDYQSGLNFSRTHQFLMSLNPLTVTHLNSKEKAIISFNERAPEHSSEHIVFFATLGLNGQNLDVVVKFRINRDKVFPMDRNHAQQMLNNYSYLNNFLKLNHDLLSGGKIVVNNIYLFKIEEDILWCERRLPRFKKFVEFNNPDNYLRLIISTSRRLESLQRLMFKNTNNPRRTIVDMQGSYDTNTDTVTLTDIEYTDTMEKFNFSTQEFFKKTREYIISLEEIDTGRSTNNNIAADTNAEMNHDSFNCSII